MGGVPGQVKRDTVTFGDGESRRGCSTIATQRDGCAQTDGVRSGNREHSLVDFAAGRDQTPVVKLGSQPHLHRDAATHPLDNPNDVVVRVTKRHAVHEADHSTVGLEIGLQDQSARAVTSPDTAHAIHGRDQPVAVGLPCPAVPWKKAGESNRGTHDQSIEPLVPTRASVSVSPMMA